MSLSDAERIDRLRLIRSENVGPVSFLRLMERFATAAAALEALPDLARRGGRSAPLRLCPRGAAEEELRRIDKLGAALVAPGEAGYPPLLSRIPDPPPLLCVKGGRHLVERPVVAIVGARNASAGGRQIARQMAARLAEEGVLVASGLARGIDAAAHEGALAGGTAAVLAGGIDVVYPPENRELQERIGTAGLLLCEMPPGTEPQARHFPRRNRIVSGMSAAVVVVEASPKSGSLITARLAGEQGREVMAVPGSPLDPRCRGSNGLIKDGAALVEDADDVLALLRNRPSGLAADAGSGGFGAGPGGAGEAGEDLDEARRVLREALGPTPVAVDEILRQCHMSHAALALLLLELELAGRLERHPGGRVAVLMGP